MEIYLDNSATTKCDPEVAELIVKTLTEDYGNPSSLHIKGIEAERYVRRASAQIAKTLHCREKEILFTSGGTESNNLALIGTALANRRSGSHIISTNVEHPSVKKTLAFLEENGFRITMLPVDENGMVSPEDLRDALSDDTILVSVMMVNNEIGALEPVAELADVIKSSGSGAIFHVDAIQAYGKFQIRPKQTGIDLLSVSGHKIHGPKGVGFLYIREGTKISPICFGGGQQNGMRSGTINVPGIAGLGLAAEKIYDHMEEKTARMYELREYMMNQLSVLEGVKINSIAGKNCAPHILNASFTGVRSEVMLHALEGKGIYVSSGSACSSHHPSDRSTLMSIGKPKEITDSAIRFSFSDATTRQEIDDTLQAVRELLPKLRKFVRR